MTIGIGTVVVSAAGRDKGGFMAITAVDGGFVYIADGKERKLLCPKKKNIKHVRLTRHTLDMSGMTDKRLRRTLAALRGEATPEESE